MNDVFRLDVLYGTTMGVKKKTTHAKVHYEAIERALVDNENEYKRKKEFLLKLREGGNK